MIGFYISKDFGSLAGVRCEPSAANFFKCEIALDDRLADARPAWKRGAHSQRFERRLQGQIASDGSSAGVIGHHSAMDKVVRIEVKRRHGDVDLESGLVVFFDLKVFLLSLALGRHADGPSTEGGLVRQGVVQADGAEIRLCADKTTTQLR